MLGERTLHLCGNHAIKLVEKRQRIAQTETRMAVGGKALGDPTTYPHTSYVPDIDKLGHKHHIMPGIDLRNCRLRAHTMVIPQTWKIDPVGCHAICVTVISHVYLQKIAAAIPALKKLHAEES